MVVTYHFWPGRLSGGYAGVDVFFVISGFLITGHLMREYGSTGRIKLAQFWARRARRLLPAALLVALFCAVVVSIPVLFPVSGLERELKEILASTFYFENWYLVGTSADYLAHSGDPSTMQHYWSLSLEEQFYVIWPLLILAAGWLATKLFSGRRLLAVASVIGGVTLLSLVFGIWLTLAEPAAAYFVTFGRMWEFGLGALIALVPRLRVHHPVVSFVIGWLGVFALVYTAVRYDQATAFPGWAALLPALGAAAVIAASNTRGWWQPTRLLSIRPMRFVGDISYSLYLWHWPLIIIAPSVPFWGLSIYHRVALLGICFLLAWLTKRFVEDPFRSTPALVRRAPRVSLWSALAAMVVVGLVAGGGWLVNRPAYQQGVQELAELRANPPKCFGAAVALDASCAGTTFGDKVLPDAGFAGADRPSDEDCFLHLNDARPVECTFGSSDPNAPTVALIGDSHANQVLSTFKRMAESNGWRLVTYLKGACPWNATPIADQTTFGQACTAWRNAVTQKLEASPPDVVFTAALATTPYLARGYDSAHDAAVAGYRDAWAKLSALGTRVVTVVDNPVWETDPNKCLRTRAIEACVGDRADVLDSADPIKAAAEGADVTLLDFTKVYCDDMICPAVVGGANVYRDQDHLTVSFVDSLAPQYTAAIKAALAAKS